VFGRYQLGFHAGLSNRAGESFDAPRNLLVGHELGGICTDASGRRDRRARGWIFDQRRDRLALLAAEGQRKSSCGARTFQSVGPNHFVNGRVDEFPPFSIRPRLISSRDPI
jgi:hypothetical protein